MTELVPAIHAETPKRSVRCRANRAARLVPDTPELADVDGRHKAGHDAAGQAETV